MKKRETPEERTERFMRTGLVIGTLIGVGAGSLYALSDLNPNQGRFLSSGNQPHSFVSPHAQPVFGLAVRENLRSRS